MKYILLILLLFSCKTTKINKDFQHVKIDSTSSTKKVENTSDVSKVNNSFLKTDNSTSLVVQKEDDTSCTYIFPILIKIDSGSKTEYPKIQKGGFTYAVVPSSKTTTNSHKENTSKVNNNIKDTSTFSFIHINNTNSETSKNVKVNIDVSSKNKNKKTTKINIWWLIIIPIVYFGWKYKGNIINFFTKLIKFL